MGVITVLAIGAAVGAAASAASAVVQKKSADKAASIQKKGLTKQQQLLERELDPDTVNNLARNADELRAKNRLSLQKEIDPELAATRQLGKEQILQAAKTDRTGEAAQQLYKEQFKADPRIEALKDSLIYGAQKDLADGATLPPEFQAELVRSGLNTGAQAGIGVGTDSIGGPTARVLGQAGVELQQSRENMALKKLEGAQRITDARTTILAGIFPKVAAQQAQAAAATFAVGDATVPEAGLSGLDMANLQIQKAQAMAGIIKQKTAIGAQQAKDAGNYNSALIGAGAAAVQSGTNIYAGASGIGGLSGIQGANRAAAARKDAEYEWNHS